MAPQCVWVTVIGRWSRLYWRLDLSQGSRSQSDVDLSQAAVTWDMDEVVLLMLRSCLILKAALVHAVALWSSSLVVVDVAAWHWLFPQWDCLSSSGFAMILAVWLLTSRHGSSFPSASLFFAVLVFFFFHSISMHTFLLLSSSMGLLAAALFCTTQGVTVVI